MKAGYARCPTNESRQDIERQVRELKLYIWNMNTATRQSRNSCPCFWNRHRRAIPSSH